MAKNFVYLAIVDGSAASPSLASSDHDEKGRLLCRGSGGSAGEEVPARFDEPEILNTDRGSQLTSMAFTAVPLREKIAISMDAWRDDVIVECLWRSVKYDEVYLRAYGGVSEARSSIGRYLSANNGRRPHSSLVPERPTRPILIICSWRWQHEFGNDPWRHSGRATPSLHDAKDRKIEKKRQTIQLTVADHRSDKPRYRKPVYARPPVIGLSPAAVDGMEGIPIGG